MSFVIKNGLQYLAIHTISKIYDILGHQLLKIVLKLALQFINLNMILQKQCLREEHNHYLIKIQILTYPMIFMAQIRRYPTIPR